MAEENTGIECAIAQASVYRLGQPDSLLLHAAFSADGKRCLTVQELNIARIWRVETGQCVEELRPVLSVTKHPEALPGGQPRGWIETVALDPTGTLALLGLDDGTAHLFSVANGMCLAQFSDPSVDPMISSVDAPNVAFSPDGSLILVNFYGRTVGVWRAEDRAPLALLRHSEAACFTSHGIGPHPSSVAASLDNRYVFAGDGNRIVSLWELATEELVFSAREHIENTLGLSVAEDRVRWATSGGILWEAVGEEDPVRILQTGENWREVVFAPDGQQYLVRTASGQVKLWTLTGQTTHLSAMESGHWADDTACTMGFGQANERLFYPLQPDCVVLETELGKVHIQRETQLVFTLLSPSGEWLAIHGWSEPIELRSACTGEKQAVAPTFKEIHSLAFSPESTLLAVAESRYKEKGGSFPIHLLRLPDLQSIASLRGHEHEVRAMAFGPEGSWLVSVSLDRTVRLWNIEKGAYRELRRREVPDLSMYVLHVLSDGRILIFREAHIEVWNSRFETLAVLSTGTTGYRKIWAVSPDESQIYIADPMQTVHVWDLTTGKRVRSYVAPISRPERFPPKEYKAYHSTGGGEIWRIPGGPYINVGGPRYWHMPVTLYGENREVAIPFKDRAIHFMLEPALRPLLAMPFYGTPRAGCVVDGKMLLVNEDCELFQSLPTPSIGTPTDRL